MDDVRMILAVVVAVAYAAKRMVQKVKDAKTTKPWYKETETWGLIAAELEILFGGISRTLGAVVGS